MNKICIITGSTDGIGKQTAIELAKLGYVLGLVGRDKNKGEKVISDIQKETKIKSLKFFQSDLSLIHQIKSVSQQIQDTYDSIDVLINNAGAYFTEMNQTDEGFETTFALNHLNYFVFTHELMDMIKDDKPGRVVNIALMAHRNGKLDFQDLQMRKKYSGWTAYCRSKLMNIMFTYECHHRYFEYGVTFNSLHPGFVNTSFGDNNSGFAKQSMHVAKALFAINVEKGAKTVVYVAHSSELKNVSGKFFNKCKPAKSSSTSMIKKDQKILWAETEALLTKM
ncbi:MAG: short-chain dehydrogenase [Candidatus Marinimicrobia bacterium]|nr:short-chain dehydrogenase [Candidatus Neomarinimicrobiota bacterium]